MIRHWIPLVSSCAIFALAAGNPAPEAQSPACDSNYAPEMGHYGHGSQAPPAYGGPAGGGTGGYSGPAGGGTTPNGGGGGNTPGGGGGGGHTPGGQGGGGGGSTPSGGAPAGGGHAPGGPAPKAPGGRGAGSSGKAKADDSANEWDAWWEANSVRFLRSKARIRLATGSTTNKDTETPGGGDPVADAARTARALSDSIAPALELALKDASFDVRAASSIALGKISRAADKERITRLVAMLADERQDTREAACLGLGLAGNADHLRLLLDVFGNTPAGRKACARGTNDIETRARAFAAMSIGLIGSRVPVGEAVVDELLAAVKTGAQVDLRVAPLVALGIMKSQRAIPELQALVRDANGDEPVRAHAATALGKLLDHSAVKVLVEALGDKRAQVQRSAAIALGLVTPMNDDGTVAKIIAGAKTASDRAVRNFCLIALGEIGNPKGRDFLVSQVTTRHGHDQTFSAIALGIYGADPEHKSEREDLGARLLTLWADNKSEAERGALAVALGLVEYKPATKVLTEALASPASHANKGHLCVALGLMGIKDASPLIEAAATQTADLMLQRDASMALGLMQSTEAVKLLTAMLVKGEGNASNLGAAAVGLGLIGDREALAPLMKLAGSQAKEHARIFASVALGMLGDKDVVPALSLIHVNCNYLATTPALAEVMGID